MNEWRRLIHERQQSGQSVRAWCQQNEIRKNCYDCWLRIIREEALCKAENKSDALVRVCFICSAYCPSAQRKDFEMDDLLPWSEEMKSWFSTV